MKVRQIHIILIFLLTRKKAINKMESAPRATKTNTHKSVFATVGEARKTMNERASKRQGNMAGGGGG